MNMYLLRDLKLSNHPNFIVHLDPTHYKLQFSAVKVWKMEGVDLKLFWARQLFFLHEKQQTKKSDSAKLSENTKPIIFNNLKNAISAETA